MRRHIVRCSRLLATHTARALLLLRCGSSMRAIRAAPATLTKLAHTSLCCGPRWLRRGKFAEEQAAEVDKLGAAAMAMSVELQEQTITGLGDSVIDDEDIGVDDTQCFT